MQLKRTGINVTVLDTVTHKQKENCMKLLHIQASPNKERSNSRQISNYLVSQLKATETRNIDLDANPLPHVTGTAIGAFFTPEENRTADQKEAIKLSDEKVAELLSSDVVVISTPMWNFGAPSVLKAWFDHISRAGKTFAYTAEGLKGLAGGRKVYVVVSSGSVFSEGPYKSYDQLSPWLLTTFGFLGITDVEIIRVEGTNTPEAAALAISKAKARVDEVLKTH